MAIVNRTVRNFTDLDMLFTKHPFTNDVLRVTDEEAVKQSVKNLIRTKSYERLFQPELGCQITSLLFDNFNQITVNIMRRTIEEILENEEPRANLLDVIISDDSERNGVEVTVEFTIGNINLPVKVTTFLARAR